MCVWVLVGGWGVGDAVLFLQQLLEHACSVRSTALPCPARVSTGRPASTAALPPHPPPPPGRLYEVYQQLVAEGTFEAKLAELYDWGKRFGWEPVVWVDGQPHVAPQLPPPGVSAVAAAAAAAAVAGYNVGDTAGGSGAAAQHHRSVAGAGSGGSGPHSYHSQHQPQHHQQYQQRGPYGGGRGPGRR